MYEELVLHPSFFSFVFVLELDYSGEKMGCLNSSSVNLFIILIVKITSAGAWQVRFLRKTPGLRLWRIKLKKRNITATINLIASSLILFTAYSVFDLTWRCVGFFKKIQYSLSTNHNNFRFMASIKLFTNFGHDQKKTNL